MGKAKSERQVIHLQIAFDLPGPGQSGVRLRAEEITRTVDIQPPEVDPETARQILDSMAGDLDLAEWAERWRAKLSDSARPSP